MCVANWRAFEDGGVVASGNDRANHEAVIEHLRYYYESVGGPPDITAMRTYFSSVDRIEVCDYLDSIRAERPLIATNFKGHAHHVARQQYSYRFESALHEASKVDKNGVVVTVLQDGKKVKQTLRGTEDAMALLRRKLDSIDGPSRDVWGAPLDFSAPQKPPRFLLDHFGLMEGRPNVIAGYAGSAKTFLAIELAIAVVSGQEKCWGGLDVSLSGPVLHLDYEMGSKLTWRRYHRIAQAMGVDLSKHAVRGDDRQEVFIRQTAPRHSLEIIPFSRLDLSMAIAERELTRKCRGKVLCIIDSFRAATAKSGVDENSSNVRQYLDMLGKVTDATGCVFVVLHHERKMGKDDGGASAMQLMRGSSAIADALGASVRVSSRDGIISVQQGKNTARRMGEDIALVLQDSGLVHPDWKDSEKLALVRVQYEPDKQVDADSQMLLDAIVAKGPVETVDGLRDLARAAVGCSGISTARINAAISALRTSKKIEKGDAGWCASSDVQIGQSLLKCGS
jgi:hypothetical protein